MHTQERCKQPRRRLKVGCRERQESKRERERESPHASEMRERRAPGRRRVKECAPGIPPENYTHEEMSVRVNDILFFVFFCVCVSIPSSCLLFFVFYSYPGTRSGKKKGGGLIYGQPISWQDLSETTIYVNQYIYKKRENDGRAGIHYRRRERERDKSCTGLEQHNDD